jgi:non-specific serine/threonine protein kinase/serine/threonine-protein kinase
MTPADLERLFQEALDLDPTAREAFLADAANGDEHARETVRGLLKALEQADRTARWEAPALEHVATSTPLDRYRLVERIGAGGMAIVYKAIRDDDEFDKLVAIKLLLAPDPQMVAQFRRERQVLAGLEHPNIARLLDGGTSSDGAPFLVMEYIDGVPADRYVAEHRLPLRQTLELFRKICSAVAYAHRKLIVHRDLKPANILVDRTGEPKLLDFGIARLLERAAECTRTAQAMTPEYASPEQVRGEAVGTATDIYSLGVVLYQLLTGRLPYNRTAGALDLAEAIVSRPAEPLDAGFDRDLRNILAKTLAKEAERRYHSADELADDLRRYLEGYPVAARPATRAYRVRKFIARNRPATVAAAIVTLTLAAGIAAILAEARIANQRFNEVRRLAHSVLFEYHDAIADLPGSTAVRQRLVKDGLEYLDRLSRQAGSDRGLTLELAAAYLKVGDVQAHALRSNLGDTRGGLESYRRALALLEGEDRRRPGDPQTRQLLAFGYDRFAQLSRLAGDPRTALEKEQKAIGILEPLCKTGAYKLDLTLLSADNDRKEECRDVLADVYIEMARIQGATATSSLGDPDAAERWYRKAMEVYRAAPPNPAQLTTLGSLHSDLGGLLTSQGKQGEALEEYRKALELDRELNRVRSDTTARRELALAYHNVGVGLLGTKDFAAALDHFRSAGAIFDELAASDPKDSNIQVNRATNMRRMAEALYRDERYAEAAPIFRQTLSTYDDLYARDPQNTSLKRHRGTAYLLASLYYEKLHEPRATAAAGRTAASIYEDLKSDDVSLQLLARSYLQAGKGYAMSESWREAREWLRRSVETWREAESRRKLSASNGKLAMEAASNLAAAEERISPN